MSIEKCRFSFVLTVATVFALFWLVQPSFSQKIPGPVDVNVVNPVLPVRDVDRRPIEPYKVFEEQQMVQGAVAVTWCCFGEPVPEGKLLILEQMTASCQAASGEAISVSIRAGIGETSSFSDTIVWPTLSSQGTFGPTTIWNTTHQLKVYLPAGSIFGAQMSKNGTSGSASCRFHLFGQLVDAPAVSP